MNPACRICGSAGVPASWGGTTCKSCLSISAINLPTSDELARFYERYTKEYHGGGRTRHAAQRQFRWAKCYLRKLSTYAPHAKSLIDVGSANNPFPVIARDAGYMVTVADLNQPPDLPSDIRYISGSLNSASEIYQSANGQYDVVTAFAVLEHCPQPRVAAEALSRLCRQGGTIIVTMPQIGVFEDTYAMGRSNWFCPPEHLHLISEHGVRALFEKQDCDLVAAKRLEINAVRWLMRYGVGFFESMLGWGLKKILPTYWKKARENKIAYGQGIALYVLRKKTKALS